MILVKNGQAPFFMGFVRQRSGPRRRSVTGTGRYRIGLLQDYGKIVPGATVVKWMRRKGYADGICGRNSLRRERTPTCYRSLSGGPSAWPCRHPRPLPAIVVCLEILLLGLVGIQHWFGECGAWAGCRHELGVRGIGDFVHNPSAAHEFVARQRDVARACGGEGPWGPVGGIGGRWTTR